MTFVDPGGHAVDELFAAVAASLSSRLAEISQDVTGHLAAAIEQLQGDTAILGVLRASVRARTRRRPGRARGIRPESRTTYPWRSSASTRFWPLLR
jgi:hypothetical protein